MRAAALLLGLAWTASAAAQQVVTSPAPEAVSVTVYRSTTVGPIELRWLDGYALITETRTIHLPAGESVIRFEGVAGNILPVSAIVRGLPREVTEKNHDARLLSAGALVDASLGRQVHIRRTDRATGKVSETEAIIRSGPDGIVLQTREGFEALRCTGLPETLVYGETPPGLSAKPTLAITTRSDAPVTATVQLSYLAGQFDWRADYVATVAPDGRTLDLFAWLTIANANDESFPDASTQVVAGRPNREEDEGDRGASPASPEISLHCWPAGTTSDVPYQVPPQPAPPIVSITADEISLTGARMRRANLESVAPVTAQLEALGDLKLYRIPLPVTVAANAQKQVALFHLEHVRFQHLYAASVTADDVDVDDDEPIHASILLRSKNVTGMGLGRPLPSGSVAVFEPAEGKPMLVGEAPIDDTPVGQELEIDVGESPDVSIVHEVLPRPKSPGKDEDDRPVRHQVVVSNAKAAPIDLELRLDLDEEDSRLAKPSHALARKNGAPLWRAHVPANGTARLVYTIEARPPRDSAADQSDGGG
ncbi:MAG TPA: hypothetical protein VH331_03815 [Allosphingosinicella sp.]|jgi:hypothetical protein|nr:hypothetical protein [Allosphingosinicella sp.]